MLDTFDKWFVFLTPHLGILIYFVVVFFSESTLLERREESERLFGSLVALSAHYIGLSVTQCK